MRPKKRFTTGLSTALLVAAMLLSSTGLFAQVKIGTNPTTIGANSNLEVEAANNKKVIVNKTDGTVVIENTPVGANSNKLLSIDGVGNVQIRDVPFIPFTAFLSSTAPGLANLPTTPFNAGAIVPLTADAGYPGYNPVTRHWTVPSDGVYSITYNAGIKANTITHTYIFQLYAGGVQLDDSEISVSNNPYSIARMGGTIRMTAGTIVQMIVIGRDPVGPTMHGVGYSAAFSTFSVIKVGE